FKNSGGYFEALIIYSALNKANFAACRFSLAKVAAKSKYAAPKCDHPTSLKIRGAKLISVGASNACLTNCKNRSHSGNVRGLSVAAEDKAISFFNEFRCS